MAATLFSRIYGVNVFEPTLGWAEKVAFRHGLRKRHMSWDGCGSCGQHFPFHPKTQVQTSVVLNSIRAYFRFCGEPAD